MEIMGVVGFSRKGVSNIRHVPSRALPGNDVLHLPPGDFVPALPIIGIPHGHRDANAFSGKDSVRMGAPTAVKGPVGANGINHTTSSG
jgi:hypothetical protein